MGSASDPHRSRPYESARVALLTRHGKEQALAPAIATLGASLEVVADFDTDSLGTFTRDVPREGTPLEAARRKACIAIERSGCPLGLGSEGSFGPGPFGLGAWNLELVLLVDGTRGIEVAGRAHGPGLHVHGLARSFAEAEALAERAGFPLHALVLRPDRPSDALHRGGIRKGIRDRSALAAAFEAALRESAEGVVSIESDLRAHQHPTRMAMIERAGLDLVGRLATPCPTCGSPGFGWSSSIPGLPCGACGTETELPVADVHACVRCGFREERRRAEPASADPARCPCCNP